MIERYCDVCGDQIHGARDRIFALLPNAGPQIQIVATADVPVDLCMDCIRDVVKNRKFTRTKIAGTGNAPIGDYLERGREIKNA